MPQRVDVAGVIQRVAIDTPGHLIAELVAFDGTPFRLTVAGHWQQPLPQALVNAQVRVTGVLARLVLPEPQTRGAAPARAAAATRSRSSAGRRPIRSTAFALDAGSLEHLTPAVAPYRVRIRGFVTLQRRARTSSSRATAAPSASISTPARTSPASARRSTPAGSSRPATRRRSAAPCCEPPARRRALQDAVTRPLAHLLRDDAAGRLTRTSAFVVERHVKGQEQRLTLVDDDVVLTATVPLAQATAALDRAGQPRRADRRARARRRRLADDGASARRAPVGPRRRRRPAWSPARRSCRGTGIAAGVALLSRPARRAGLGRRTSGAQRRTSEARLARSREQEALLARQHDELIEHANDLICTWDATGALTSFNRAGQRMIGRLRQDVVGRQLAELAPPITRRPRRRSGDAIAPRRRPAHLRRRAAHARTATR